MINLEPPSRFLRDLLEAVGGKGVDLARSFLRNSQGSETLQESLSFFIQSLDDAKGVGKIVVPYYWAEYHHDGRGPINAKPGKYLVFFPDKRLDPRTLGGADYPRTRQQARSAQYRLNAAEFYRYLEINRERRIRGESPIMVVTKSVGPANRKRPYFTVGLAPLPAFADLITLPMFRAYLQRSGFFKTEKVSTKGSIGR